MNYIPTHPEADSFISLAEANSYLGDRWTNFGDELKESYLIQATMIVNSFNFRHKKYYFLSDDTRLEQRLKFPTITQNSADVFVSSTSNTGTDYTIQVNEKLKRDFWVKGVAILMDGNNLGGICEITANTTTSITVTSSVSINATKLKLIEAIPYEVRIATAEQALFLSQNSGVNLSANGVTSYKIGDLSETYGDYSTMNSLCERARLLLRGYIVRTGQLHAY